MPSTESTLHPNGPLASAIEVLERYRFVDEVAAVRQLWMERIEFREQAAMAEEKFIEIRAIIDREM